MGRKKKKSVIKHDDYMIRNGQFFVTEYFMSAFPDMKLIDEGGDRFT